MLLLIIMMNTSAIGPGVAFATSRKVPESIPGLSLGIFSEASDKSMCSGVDSASKNEYQDIPGVKAAGA
jgi:hypothetical protein